MAKDTVFWPKKTMNCGGKIINLSSPLVMGIMNITPDSFYDGGRYRNPLNAVTHAGELLSAGASIIDMGAASSRPGAGIIDSVTEQKRLMPALKAVVKQYPEAIISIDTYHSSTAKRAIESGAHIINDISAGNLDPAMFETIANLQVPYIMMHMQGTPENMQHNPVYENLVKEIAHFFSERIKHLKQLGVHDILIDPGFGFGKTLEQNYRLLESLDYFSIFERPLVVGLSRKSMVNKVLGVNPSEALNGTSVLHTLALQNGADILRVHDVKEAAEAINIVRYFQNHR